MFDGRRIIAVFQPHRYSRTFSLYDHFVRSFNIPDITVITEIFPAGESPIDSVNGEKLSSDIKKETGKTVLYGEDLQKTFNILKNILKKDDVLLILGAGNVTRLSDQISQFLKNKEGALR